jgi:cytochrome c
MKIQRTVFLTTAFVAVLMATSGDAFAHPEAGALVDEQHCMFCHNADAPHLAPSFPQIAQRYRTMPGARSALAQKVSLEGSAHWGAITMPVSDRVDPLTPNDAQTVAQWVLNQ